MTASCTCAYCALGWPQFKHRDSIPLHNALMSHAHGLCLADATVHHVKTEAVAKLLACEQFDRVARVVVNGVVVSVDAWMLAIARKYPMEKTDELCALLMLGMDAAGIYYWCMTVLEERDWPRDG